MMMKCPKCGYERTAQDDKYYPKTECPKCSVIYARIGIKEKREKKAELEAQKELERKAESEERWKKKIQQWVTEIHSMPESERIQEILDMDTDERKEFLKHEVTISKLKGMSFLERRSYLYDGLWNSCKDSISGFWYSYKDNIISFVQLIFIFVGIVVVITGSIYMISNLPKSIPEERTARTVSIVNSPYDSSVYQVKSYLKSTAKDPSSLEFISWSQVVKTGNIYTVRTRYRGKNSFGAFVVEEKIFHLDESGNVIGVQSVY